MLIAILLGLWLTMTLARGTPIGGAMQRALVEAPAARLSRITRGQVLLALAIGGLALTLIWLLENDGRLLVAMGLPEVMSFAVAVDLASLLDLAAVAVIAASSVRIRALWSAVVTRLRPHHARSRARRPRAQANDDDGIGRTCASSSPRTCSGVHSDASAAFRPYRRAKPIGGPRNKSGVTVLTLLSSLYGECRSSLAPSLSYTPRIAYPDRNDRHRHLSPRFLQRASAAGSLDVRWHVSTFST